MYEDTIKTSDLLFQIKLLKDKVAAFENGKKYLLMEEQHRKVREQDFAEMKKLRKEIEVAWKAEAHSRDIWFEQCLYIEKEYERKLKKQKQVYEQELKKKELENERLRMLLWSVDDRHKQDCEKLEAALKKIDEMQNKLNDEEEKNDALNARLNKDYSNSSKSSSQSPNHKKIYNSREKTGRPVGAQKGHVHCGRKRREPTATVEIPPTDEYKKSKNYKLTGRMIHKQLIRFMIVPEVIDYVTPEYRRKDTGQRVHAPFPDGIKDDVNYDGSIKAFAYLINNGLYTSIEKTKKFLSDISHGLLDVSTGFISGLAKEFSEKTESHRNEIFLSLASSEIMHSDFTFGRMDGKQTAVSICATKEHCLYQARETKGDEGVKGTPLEVYEGTLVSDHESSLKKHGSRHQECLSHIKRYSKGVIENEPTKKWGTKLEDWIKRSVGFWDDVDGGKKKYEKRIAQKYIKELKMILKEAEEEYEKEPPSKYNRDGYNLYKRMKEGFDDYVLFLKDPKVPPTNNLAERQARKFKRKANQVMAFRSQESVSFFCDGLTVLEGIKTNGENVYDAVSKIFNKEV